MLTDMGPQLVPARVSVVLVEETGVRCAERLASVPADLDEQMLAEVAYPAGVAEYVDDFILQMLAGTVSPSDVTEQVADDAASLADAGILFPVVPARIPFLAGHVGPVGPDGTLSSSDPAGYCSQQALWALLALLASSDPAGILFPAVPAGKLFLVAPDRNGMLSPTDPAGFLFPAIPAGMPFPVDSNSDGTLSPTSHAEELFQAVLTEFPVLKGPVVVQLPADPTAIDTRNVVDIAVVEEVRPVVPDVVHGRAVVAMVGIDAVHTGEDSPMNCDDDDDM